MIKSPLKGSGLKLNVYVAQIGGIHLAESCTLDTKLYKIVTELAMTTILSHGRCTS